MSIAQCSMPANCAFSPDRADYYYCDSFEGCLSQTDLSMSDIYLGIFAHPPAWLGWLLILRTRIVSLLGIKGPTSAQLNNVETKKSYVPGEKIALFTLFSQDDNEIVTGGDDKHLDFRVSLQRLEEGGVSKVVLTTVVSPHNLFGKVYLFFILPFHKLGVKAIMANAVTSGRI